MGIALAGSPSGRMPLARDMPVKAAAPRAILGP